MSGCRRAKWRRTSVKGPQASSGLSPVRAMGIWMKRTPIRASSCSTRGRVRVRRL